MFLTELQTNGDYQALVAEVVKGCGQGRHVASRLRTHGRGP